MPLPADKAAKGAATANPAPAPSLAYKAKATATVNLPPESPYVYRWSPERWELVTVDGKAVLVPQLAKLLLTPGVNGVPGTRAGGGGLAARTAEDVEVAAVKASEEKGWRHLDPSAHVEAKHLPPGVDAGPLRRSVNVLGGVRFHDPWETHVPSAAGPARVVYHREHLHRWLAAQVEAGAFGFPPADVVVGMRAALVDLRERKEARLSTVDAAIRNARLAPIDAEIKALEAADA